MAFPDNRQYYKRIQFVQLTLFVFFTREYRQVKKDFL